MLLDENGGPDHWLDEQLHWERITAKRQELGLEINWKDPRFQKLMKEEGIWFGESPILCDMVRKAFTMLLLIITSAISAVLSNGEQKGSEAQFIRRVLRYVHSATRTEAKRWWR